MIIRAAMLPATWLRFIQNWVDSLSNTLSQQKEQARLSNGVYCYAILFGDDQDKSFLFVVVHMFASSVYITQ